MDPLEDIVFHFLDEHYDQTHPVLLGLSGGPDSLALFYLLLSYKKNSSKKSFSFGIAHVDHGWRPESAEEARQLQQLATTHNIPFHMKELDPTQIVGNLEEKCRLERLGFFTQLCEEYSYQAIILGHHADDRSETILKKVLEGSSLPYLYGMSPISKNQSITLWRPLLNCSKSHIKNWLDQNKYIPFDDKTNFDKKFLRGRFRTKIIPDLSREFGKEISLSLCRIGQEAEELKSYLDAHLGSFIDAIATGPFGSMLDFGNIYPKPDFEIKYLIRKLCEKEGIRLSHHLITQACKKIHDNSSNCYLNTHKNCLYLDRRRLFIVRQPVSEFDLNIPIQLGSYSVNRWNIQVREADEESMISGWKDAWLGHMHIQVPQGQFFLKKGDSTLFKWWTNAKVPAILRKMYPVLWLDQNVVHEFLTKRRFSNIIDDKRKKWLISIHYKPNLLPMKGSDFSNSFSL